MITNAKQIIPIFTSWEIVILFFLSAKTEPQNKKNKVEQEGICRY